MATVNFSVPEDVKQALNDTFVGQDKGAVLTQLMREAIERVQRQRDSDAAIQRFSDSAIQRILTRHPQAPVRSVAQLDKARKAGRP